MTTASSAFRQAILDFVPHLRMRADEAERQRKLAPETIAGLREIGLFRALVPRSYGGDQRSLSELLDAITELAVGCASTAWVGSLLAIHNMAVCWLAREGQEEIFGEGPDVLVSSSVAPTGKLARVARGYRLGGRWGFSSGVDHASWIMLGSLVDGDAGAPAEYVLCFLRIAEVTVIDDWRVAGLRATGSKSVELRDVFVPAHRALLLRTVEEGTAPGLALHPQPFYRLPWRLVFNSAFPPAALGTAISMLDGFREYTASRVNRFSGEGFRRNGRSAMRMAEAAAQIDAARLMFERDVDALDRLALQGQALAPGAAERICYHTAFLIDACSRAVLQLYRGSGGRVLYETSPLQRHFRDIHAMTQHATMDLDFAGELYGQSLFQNAMFAFGAARKHGEQGA
jgi:3-hydroxy-9,10-secoandrosta-1,3,5(10)-triene-9,17-dione monooxygenase